MLIFGGCFSGTLAMLYSLLPTLHNSVLFLVGSGDHTGFSKLNPSQSCAREVPHLLYYYSGPNAIFIAKPVQGFPEKVAACTHLTWCPALPMQQQRQ